MKHLLILISTAMLLGSCWRSETPKTFVRPVKLTQATSLNTYEKDFVGVVSAEQYTNLAFQVGGLVKEVYVTAGSAVKKGQLLAQLDSQDYDLQLNADKAQYQSAKSILERNERLLSRQAISTQDVEIARANYQKAKSAYSYSLNQLEYTKLRAPFTGSVETKYVENYQKVHSGEKIFKIINPSILEVRFTLPETDINVVKTTADYFVEFDNIRGINYKAKIKEIVDASVDGMGIPVTLAITDPAFNAIKQNIKAGFACRVKVSIINNLPGFSGYVKVPVTSVFVDNTSSLDKFVWIYNPQTGTVSKRKVTTRGLMGTNEAIIAEGVAAGENVVEAGVYQLVDNQTVTVLK